MTHEAIRPANDQRVIRKDDRPRHQEAPEGRGRPGQDDRRIETEAEPEHPDGGPGGVDLARAEEQHGGREEKSERKEHRGQKAPRAGRAPLRRPKRDDRRQHADEGDGDHDGVEAEEEDAHRVADSHRVLRTLARLRAVGEDSTCGADLRGWAHRSSARERSLA